jgi:AraC family transcriptional regulator
MSHKQSAGADSTEELTEVTLRAPLLSSHTAEWHNILLEHHRQPAWEIPEHCNPQHTVIIHHAKTQVERILNGHRQIEQIVEGNIAIVPAETLHQSRWNQESEVTLLMLEPSYFAQIAYESMERTHVELVGHFAKPDPLVYQIGLALKTQLETNAVNNRLYVESAITLLSTHLLQNYSSCNDELRSYSEGLSKRKLHQAIAYMHDRLSENISLAKIAQEIDMSQYHFCRLFKQSTGLSPHQYLIRQRVERAIKLLHQNKLSISEVALAVGFCDQSRLNRYLKRLTGLTPKQIQNQ